MSRAENEKRTNERVSLPRRRGQRDKAKGQVYDLKGFPAQLLLSVPLSLSLRALDFRVIKQARRVYN